LLKSRGRFATLLDVVDHYDTFFSLGLPAQEKNDLVEYLKSLPGQDGAAEESGRREAFGTRRCLPGLMKPWGPVVLSLLLGVWASAGTASPLPPLPRPAEWATVVDGTSVSNLYRVEDGLYRGAQPTPAGFKELVALGVRSVLDLAGGPGDDTLIEKGVEKGSLTLFHVPMSAFGLRDDRVLDALRIMADPKNRPLLIHCQHGADRTGAMVALYRVVVQGWTAENAVEEMNRGGYHHSGLFKNLETYVLKADAAAIRQKLGLKAPIAPNAPAATLAILPAPAAAGAPPSP
jgi:protein tyrosine phosphatase (PTP) superfamily phosphohydrolase (DUF442 family)